MVSVGPPPPVAPRPPVPLVLAVCRGRAGQRDVLRAVPATRRRGLLPTLPGGVPQAYRHRSDRARPRQQREPHQRQGPLARWYREDRAAALQPRTQPGGALVRGAAPDLPTPSSTLWM